MRTATTIIQCCTIVTNCFLLFYQIRKYRERKEQLRKWQEESIETQRRIELLQMEADMYISLDTVPYYLHEELKSLIVIHP